MSGYNPKRKLSLNEVILEIYALNKEFFMLILLLPRQDWNIDICICMMHYFAVFVFELFFFQINYTVIRI